MKITPPSQCHICYESTLGEESYHQACLMKLFHTTVLPSLNITDEELNKLAFEYVIQKKGLPGVQQKLSLSLKKAENSSKRLTMVGYLGGEYILKPPTKNYPYMPEIEDLTMHLAEIAKIDVALHGLIAMENGALAYITRRFDRIGKQKIAVEDMCQLSFKSTEDKYRSSTEKVGKIIRNYTANPGNEVLKFFELILFCFLVGNADMHLKNFTLITEQLNNIKLAPSYDLLSTKLLIPSHMDPEELALPVNGKKSNLRKKDFYALGQSLQIPEKVIKMTISLMINNWSKWGRKIDQSFLTIDLKARFKTYIIEKMEKIG